MTAAHTIEKTVICRTYGHAFAGEGRGIIIDYWADPDAEYAHDELPITTYLLLHDVVRTDRENRDRRRCFISKGTLKEQSPLHQGDRASPRDRFVGQVERCSIVRRETAK